jgi:hypothetical protein
MRTRDQIIVENLRLHKRTREKSQEGDYYKTIAEEQGQTYADELRAEFENYPTVIRLELEKRLTEETYLTCEDFDHFDTNCCETCHTCYPHYEMSIVVLSDGRHAWLCDSVKGILMRHTKFVPSSPEGKEKFRLLAEIFGAKPDPIEDELHEASLAACSDEERLYYCIKYSHHIHKRKRGHKTIETLVQRALRLPGRGPARSARIAGGEGR